MSLVKLDRPGLVEDRRERHDLIVLLARFAHKDPDAARLVERHLRDDAPYAAMVRAALR